MFELSCKTFKHFALFVVLIPLSLALTGCEKPKKRFDLHATIFGAYGKVTPVKGDPFSYVRNSQMTGNIGLPAELFTEGSRWQVHPFSIAEEIDETSVSYEAAVEAQTPVDSDDDLKARSALVGRIVKLGDIHSFRVEDKSEWLQLNFKKNSQGTFALDSSSNSDGENHSASEVEVLHVSYRPDLSAYSILIYDGRTAGKRSLDTLIFTRVEHDDHESWWKRLQSSTEYEYMFGRGLKIGWPQKEDLTVTVCGSVPDGFRQLPAQALDHWKRPLSGRLSLKLTVKASCPPFSDLNSHVIRFIDGYVDILGPDEATAAQTILFGDFESGKLIDADVMILLAEWDEALQSIRPGSTIWDSRINRSQKLQAKILDALIHEFGHVLGLHHQFRIPSVMSYSEEDDGRLHDYDIKAIQELYPLIENQKSALNPAVRGFNQ